MSDSLQPYGLQHARLPCPSPTPKLAHLMSIQPVMPSNHLVLYCPLLLLPSIFPSIRVFSNESVLCIRWPKYWSFNFSISPSNEYSGLITLLVWSPCCSSDSQKSSPIPHQERRKREDFLRELHWKQGDAVINPTLSDQLCNFKRYLICCYHWQ